jgi:hypothetical protein
MVSSPFWRYKSDLKGYNVTLPGAHNCPGCMIGFGLIGVHVCGDMADAIGARASKLLLKSMMSVHVSCPH